jgi:hypothetical protein
VVAEEDAEPVNTSDDDEDDEDVPEADEEIDEDIQIIPGHDATAV